MNLRSLFYALTGGVTIKLPAAYDMAGSYESVPDWSKVAPKPLLVIHKATEGNFYKDPSLAKDFAGMAANGIRRGAYHFHRKAITAVTQARYFCDYVRGVLDKRDFLALDIEEGGETPAQIIAWIDEVERQYSNEIIIYSRENLLSPLADKCTPAQLTRLKKYRLWIAGYPTFPNLYDTIPAGYIPAKLGEVILWQYSDKGIVAGVTGAIDLNWVKPSFAAELGVVDTPPSDVISNPYDGVKRTTGTRYGWKFVIHEIDPAKATLRSIYNAPKDIASNVGKNENATLVINGGEHSWETGHTINYTVSDGIVEILRTSAQPSLMVVEE